MLIRGPRGIVSGTSGTGSAKFYSLGNRGVKKWTGPGGTGFLGFSLASLFPSLKKTLRAYCPNIYTVYSGSQRFIISNVLAAYFHTFITKTYEGLFNSPYAIFGRCTFPNYGKGALRRTRWSCDTRYGPSINDVIIFFKKNWPLVTKAELPQESILFCTQFPSLFIFVHKKSSISKKRKPSSIRLLKLI